MRPRGAERAVLGLLGLSTLAAVGFVVAYALTSSTQLLGLALGLSLACLAAAAGLAGTRLVAQETAAEPLPSHGEPRDEAAVERIVEEGAEGITRHRLLVVAGAGAVGALGAAIAVPALSLGPAAHPGRLRRSPWRAGLRLVDEDGRPVRADALAVGSYVAAFPEDVDRAEPGAPVAVVRVRADELDLPAGRAGWAPLGILAFSSICTHAGCAVTLFRHPTFEPTSEAPALVCPCHYSTFAVARGGDVVFGPAGRALPQLPLVVGADGVLEAGGELSGAPGPSWWGVRL